MKRLLLVISFILASNAFCMEMEDAEQVDVVLLDDNKNEAGTVRTTRRSLNRFQVIKEALDLDKSEDKKPAVHAKKEPLEVLFNLARIKDEAERNDPENVDALVKAKISKIKKSILLDVLVLADKYFFEDLEHIVGEVVKRLDKFSLESIVQIPGGGIDSKILDFWQKNNLQKISASGCRKPVELKAGGYIWSVSMSNNNKIIAAGDVGARNSKEIFDWNFVNAAWQLVTFVGHLKRINAVNISADGQTIVSGSEDGLVKIWDRQLYSFNLERRVYSLAITKDAKKIAVGCDSGKVYVLTLGPSGAWLKTELSPNFSNVNSIAFSNDGNTLVTGGLDGRVVVLNFVNNDWLIKKEIQAVGAVYSVDITPDARRLIFSVMDKEVFVYDLVDGGYIQTNTLEGYDRLIYSVAISANGNRIVSADLNGELVVWNRNENGTWIKDLLYKSRNSLFSVIISEDGSRIVSGGVNKVVVIDYSTLEDCGLTLPIAYAISKDQLTESEKELLKNEIDFGTLHSGIAAHLRNKGVSNIRPREE